MKKNIILFIFIIFISSILFADRSITRGPDIGEIYFKGPLVSNDFGIFHSINFGETITCVDSTVFAVSIAADLTQGGLYFVGPGEGLFYSDNYGQQGSWDYRNSGIYQWISSGRNEGEIYNAIVSHSEDYGVNFIPHQYNGFFGNLNDVCIDNSENIGYAILKQSSVPDSLYLLITYDNFDNLEIRHIFNLIAFYPKISRGTDNGELYLYTENPIQYAKELRYSNDYGITWDLKNTFNCPSLPIVGIVGGRQPGELYMLVIYIQSLQFIKHLYIYHSTDYGETFTIYHPIAIGPDPVYADFEATPKSGSAPLTVQFTDLSGGDPGCILGWEWDFNDDGVIDSYEQHPEYTYQDTGYYSVKLLILATGIGDEAIAYRKDYIHVTDGNIADNYELGITNYEFNNYPNPFNPETTFEYFLEQDEHTLIQIYNVKGRLIETIVNKIQKAGKYTVIWNASEMSTGIYFYRIKTGTQTATGKCLLVK